MSGPSAIPVEHDMSESSSAIEACLARVRAHAGLDEDPVLPHLHLVAGRREPAPVSRRPSPPPPTSLELRTFTPSPPPPTSAPAARVEAEPKTVRRTTWPVVFCAFVVGISGGASLMMSPVADAPAIQIVVKTAKRHVADAISAAKELL